MKLSAILSAKSEVAYELEYKIETFKREIQSNIDSYDGSEIPKWVQENNAQMELKIRYFELLLKTVPGLN